MTILNLLDKNRPARIRSQLILGITLTCAVLMSLFVLEQMNHQKSFFLKLDHDRAQNLSINLANAATSNVISYEVVGLQKLVSTYKGIPGLKYALITSDDGTVLAHTSEKYIGLKAIDSISARLKQVDSTQVLAENNYILDIATPIVNHNEIVGWARVGLSQEYVGAGLAELRNSGLLFILLSLIIGSIIAIIVTNRLSKSLQKLVTAEEKIRERESQLTAFFDNIEGAASLLDAEKKYLLFNNKFIYDHRRLTNQDPYVGQKVYDLFPEEVQKERLELMDSVLKGNKEVIEVDHERDGKRIYYRTSFSPVITNGKVTGIATYSFDLTKIKEAEMKIRDSEEKFRLSFMTSQDAFYIGTLDEGRIIDANDSFYEMYGYTREETIGKTSVELNLHADAEGRAKMVAGLKTNGHLKDLELTCRKKNGEPFLISLTANIWQMNHEQVIMAVVRDITESKRVEIKIKESEEEFRVMFEGAAMGAAIVGLDGKPTRCNPALCRILGYTESELSQMAFIEFTHPEDADKDLKLFQSMFNAEINDYQIEKRYIHKDGRMIWGFLTVSLVRGQDGSPRFAVGMIEDITERKKVEAVIKEQAETFSAIIENANESITVLSPELKVLQFNKTSKDRLQLNVGKEIYTGANFKEFFHPGTENVFMPMFNDAIAGKYPEAESRQKNIHDEVFWLRTRMYPIYDTGGGLKGITVLAENITNRKKAEEEINRLNRLYQFVSQINESMLKLDSKEEILAEACNIAVEVGKFQMAWVGTYDKQNDKIIPLTWSGFEEGFFKSIGDAGLKVSTSAIPSARAIRTQSHFYYNDIEHDTSIPGEMKKEMLKRNYRSALSFPVFVDSKIIAAFVLLMSEPFFFTEEEVKLVKDVTDNIAYALDKIRIRDLRNKAEANLKQSEEKNRSLIENISDVILLINRDMHVVYQSPSYVRGANIPFSELKDKEVFEFVHPDDLQNFRDFFRQALASPGVSIQGQFRLLHKLGHYIWVEGTCINLLEMDAVKAYVVNYRDVTYRKLAEAEREKMVSDLVQRNESMEQFAYIVSHNLRAPAANIIGLSEAVQNDSLDPETKKQFMAGLSQSVHKLDDVIIDLNNILKVKREVSEQKEWIKFSKSARDIHLSIENLVEDKKAIFVLDFSEVDEMLTIKSYLYSIFYNLISNSLKYQQPNVPPVIEIKSRKVNGGIELTFKDNGLGIDMEKKGDQVFGLYKRFHLDKADGKGMGLYMVKTQVETIGGTISISSKPNIGTEFLIKFPA